MELKICEWSKHVGTLVVENSRCLSIAQAYYGFFTEHVSQKSVLSNHKSFKQLDPFLCLDFVRYLVVFYRETFSWKHSDWCTLLAAGVGWLATELFQLSFDSPDELVVYMFKLKNTLQLSELRASCCKFWPKIRLVAVYRPPVTADVWVRIWVQSHVRFCHTHFMFVVVEDHQMLPL